MLAHCKLTLQQKRHLRRFIEIVEVAEHDERRTDPPSVARVWVLIYAALKSAYLAREAPLDQTRAVRRTQHIIVLRLQLHQPKRSERSVCATAVRFETRHQRDATIIRHATANIANGALRQPGE